MPTRDTELTMIWYAEFQAGPGTARFRRGFWDRHDAWAWVRDFQSEKCEAGASPFAARVEPLPVYGELPALPGGGRARSLT